MMTSSEARVPTYSEIESMYEAYKLAMEVIRDKRTSPEEKEFPPAWFMEKVVCAINNMEYSLEDGQNLVQTLRAGHQYFSMCGDLSMMIDTEGEDEEPPDDSYSEESNYEESKVDEELPIMINDDTKPLCEFDFSDYMKEVDEEIRDGILVMDEQAPQVQPIIRKEELVEQIKEQVCDLQPKEYEENRVTIIPPQESSSAESWNKPKTPDGLNFGNFNFQRALGVEGKRKESLVPRWKNPPSAPNEEKLTTKVMVEETTRPNPQDKVKTDLGLMLQRRRDSSMEGVDGSIGTAMKPMHWEESKKDGTFIEKDETSKTRLVFDPGTFIQNFNKFSNPYTVLKEHVGECLEFITKELNDASQLDETKKSFMEEPYILEQQVTPSMKSNRMKLRSIRPISKPPWRKGEKAQSKRVWSLRYPP